MVEKNYERVIILEDDARFTFDFKATLNHFMNELINKKIKWDLLLVYF